MAKQAKADPKKEQFALLVAGGYSLVDAYVEVGFKRDRGNAARYAKDPFVQQRIEQFREEGLADDVGGISLQWYVDKLRDSYKKQFESGRYAASNKVLEIIGKTCGFFKESLNVNNTGNGAKLLIMLPDNGRDSLEGRDTITEADAIAAKEDSADSEGEE